MTESRVSKLIALLCALLLAGLCTAIAGLLKAQATFFYEYPEEGDRAAVTGNADQYGATAGGSGGEMVTTHQFDVMCDPYGPSRYNPAYPTDAMADASHTGRWFDERFRMLVENAAPPPGSAAGGLFQSVETRDP